MEENYDDCDFCEEIPERTCYVSSLDQATKLISSFEAKNTVKFSCYKADKNFGSDGELLLYENWEIHHLE